MNWLIEVITKNSWSHQKLFYCSVSAPLLCIWPALPPGLVAVSKHMCHAQFWLYYLQINSSCFDDTEIGSLLMRCRHMFFTAESRGAAVPGSKKLSAFLHFNDSDYHALRQCLKSSFLSTASYFFHFSFSFLCFLAWNHVVCVTRTIFRKRNLLQALPKITKTYWKAFCRVPISWSAW